MMGTTFLVATEAAKFLRVELSTIYAWVHQNRIPYRKHGRKLVFTHAELLEWSQKTFCKNDSCEVNRVEEVRNAWYNKSPKSDSLKTEYTNQSAKTSTHYGPHPKGGSS